MVLLTISALYNGIMVLFNGITNNICRCFFWLAICMAPSCYSYRYGEKNEIKVYATPGYEEGGRKYRGRNITTLPALGKEWTVTFDFTPSAIPTPVWMKYAPGKA